MHFVRRRRDVPIEADADHGMFELACLRMSPVQCDRLTVLRREYIGVGSLQGARQRGANSICVQDDDHFALTEVSRDAIEQCEHSRFGCDQRLRVVRGTRAAIGKETPPRRAELLR